MASFEKSYTHSPEAVEIDHALDVTTSFPGAGERRDRGLARSRVYQNLGFVINWI